MHIKHYKNLETEIKDIDQRNRHYFLIHGNIFAQYQNNQIEFDNEGRQIRLKLICISIFNEISPFDKCDFLLESFLITKFIKLNNQSEKEFIESKLKGTTFKFENENITEKKFKNGFQKDKIIFYIYHQVNNNKNWVYYLR